MAQTPAAVQAVLGSSLLNAQIIMANEVVAATLQEWYVAGNLDAPGRERWIVTTASDSAATQAAAILTALRA